MKKFLEDTRNVFLTRTEIRRIKKSLVKKRIYRKIFFIHLNFVDINKNVIANNLYIVFFLQKYLRY